MYIPKEFSQKDEKTIQFYLNKYPFGILVSCIDRIPFATHLPFAYTKTRQGLIINSHLARTNPHADHLNNVDALFIVQGPHTYISTGNYPTPTNVPTWNYIAVHLSGKVDVISSAKTILQNLDNLLAKHEKNALLQWRNADESYREGMLKRIVSFRLKVEKVECMEKLSQNRNKTEQERIMSGLAKSGDSGKMEIANYMARRLRGLQKSNTE